MDGVLIDAKDWHYEALNEALLIFGKKISRYDHLTVFDGKPTKEKLILLSNQGEIPFLLHGIINKMKQKYTIRKIFNSCKPNYTHQYALAKLKKRGYKMAVCSNSISESVKFMLTNSGIIQFFDFYISNEDVKESKPNPEMYLAAMKKFGAKPQECLILEDNENGIEAAKKSKANLLIIDDVDDVNIENISRKINELENKL